MKVRYTIFCWFAAIQLFAQQPQYARKVLNDLCSEKMAGRGYVLDGAGKAARYIAREFNDQGLSSFGSDYFQNLGYPVVTFPNQISLKIDDTEIIPGDEFIVNPGCPVINGVFDAIYIDSSVLDDPKLFKEIEKSGFSHSMFVVNIPANTKLMHPDRLKDIMKNKYKSRGVINICVQKLTWSVAHEFDSQVRIEVLKGVYKDFPHKIQIKVIPEIQTYQGSNVIGYIKGSVHPDSFVVFSAHYDHLGMMGTWALFPGGNDNASGIAMMLDLMQYYKKNPPEYSVCFMAFTGEEAGLLGSYYYTEYPLFPLSQIKILINLDLMGTGDKGMTVVNATEFPMDFQELQLINLDKNYLPTVNARGKAQNSDHYYFTEKGVKAFFFYLMGEYGAYHDVNDTPEAVTFSKYSEAFRLIRDYADLYAMKRKN